MPDREIFSRGKRLDNGEWVEGYYVHNAAGQHMMVGGCHDKSYIMTEVDPSTVCRYTGLTDKHGTRIFEGDIVKVVSRRLDGDIECSTYEVKWDDCSCGFHLTHEDELSERSTYLVPYGCYEVIGNRWDNPELMLPPPGEEDG